MKIEVLENNIRLDNYLIDKIDSSRSKIQIRRSTRFSRYNKRRMGRKNKYKHRDRRNREGMWNNDTRRYNRMLNRRYKI